MPSPLPCLPAPACCALTRAPGGQWIVASKLHHPNVIQLRDVQVSENHVFLVMELASGSELFDRGRSPLAHPLRRPSLRVPS